MREKTGGKTTRNGRDDDDEEEEGEGDDDLEDGGVDDMDLSHRYENEVQESDEEEEETPAEAKVRLARMYLDGLRDDDVGEWQSGRAGVTAVLKHAPQIPTMQMQPRQIDRTLRRACRQMSPRRHLMFTTLSPTSSYCPRPPTPRTCWHARVTR